MNITIPIFQDEVSECGLACIAMLLNMLGIPTTLSELRHKYSVSEAGMSMNEIIQVLGKYNIKASCVSFDTEQLRDLPGPAILHHGGNHFVLCAEKKGSFVRILNPATGEGVFRSSEVANRLTGYAIIIDPKQTELVVQKKSNSLISRTKPEASILKGIKFPYIPQILLLGGLSTIASLIIPLAYLKILDYIDESITKGSTFSLDLMLLAMIFGVAGSAAIEIINAKINIRSISSTARSHIPFMFFSLLRKRYPMFEKRSAADISQRFFSLSQALSTRVSVLVRLKTSLVTSAISFGVITWINPILSLLTLGVIFFYGLIHVYYLRHRTALIKLMEEASSTKNDIFLETVGGITSVKFGNIYHERTQAYSEAYFRELEISNKLNMIQAKQAALYKSVSSLEIVILLILAMDLLANQSISIGGLFAFSFLSQLTSSSVTSFYLSRLDMKEQEVIDHRASALLSHPEDKYFTSGGDFFQGFYLKSVNFCYEKKSGLISNFELSVKKGDKVAIVGCSGSGKSTLFKILSGLYIPSEGTVLLDDNETEWSSLSRLTYYSQPKDTLFKATVIENITLFNIKDRLKLMELSDSLGLTPIIERLPHGWNTTISEASPLMSSGQRQRLLIARALYSDKQIILLDEPTVNLDDDSADKIMKVIMSSPKTVLIALHTVGDSIEFNQIISMDGINQTDSNGIELSSLHS